MMPLSLRRFVPSGVLMLAALTATVHADPRPEEIAPGDPFLRDYAETRGFMLGRPVNATPTPDGTAVLFLRARAAREPSQELYEFNVANGQTRRLLSPEDALKGASEKLSPEEKARRERQRISVGGFTAFSISRDSSLVLLSLSGKLYVLHRGDGTVAELATGTGTIVDPKFSPDNRSVAYVRDQDVCVYDLAAGKKRTITTGGTETISHGLAEFVAQEEMARYSGYWWSPDSRQIVYQENDASKVESWYVSDPAQPGNPPERVFYPRPGEENVSVRLGVASARGGDAPTKWVEWDRARYAYLGKVTWTEHGPLTLTVLSRDQTDLALLKTDPETGKTAVLLTETDPAWLALDPGVPRWLPDNKGFLWSSENAGHSRLERRRADGQPDEVLSHPSQGFIALAGVAGERAYFQANMGHPLDSLVDNVPLARDETMGGLDRPVDEPPEVDQNFLAWAQANFGESETVFTIQSQSPKGMPLTMVCRAGETTREIARLPSIALDPPFAPKVEFARVGGGPDLLVGRGMLAREKPSYYTAVIRPRDFDPAAKRKYPVIVDVYGGPGHQQVVAQLRPYLLDQWMADQGFIVVAVEGRGTPGRGTRWERAIAGRFGSVPLEDQVEGLQLLGAKHPEMDMDRVGITGWSFGGYMSALAVLRRPDVFKAAVAGAPVVDWMDYDTCYTERYLGVPGAGRWPDAYREGSLLTYAAGLSRPLLLIHGTADDNVFFRHSLRLAQELFRTGRPFDFLPLSSFTHMVPDPVVRARLEERIVRHFREHL